MSRPPTIAHLAIAALAIIAVLSPAEAALDTAVVPESASAVDNDLTPNEEIQEPIRTLQQHAHTQSQEDTIKALEGQLQSLALVQATPADTETDGGTNAIAARVETMASGINKIVDTMQAGLISDHETGRSDLTKLLGAINSTQRDVTSAEKESVLLKAQKWCTAKGQLDNATTKCSDATTAHTNFDPAISVADAFYKYVGDITDCKHDTTLVNGKCPEAQPNLDATTIKLGFQNARDEYHRLDTVKATECATKQSSTTDESTNGTALDSEINAILDGHVGACDPDHTVYTTAVSAFNTNNQHRASMYKALDKVSCMVTNINVSATATTNCINGLDDDSVYAAKFPDHTTTPPTCPTRAQYATQISDFQSLLLSITWVPDATTCDAVAAAVASGSGPTNSGTTLPADSGTYDGLTGFVAFNWAKAGSTFPDDADPFGEAPGTGGCASLDSEICRGRIPTGATPTHLLVKKDTGGWALWSIDGSAKANAFLQAAQSHKTACSKAADGAWTPIASSGDGWGCGSSCNVFGYTDGTTDNICSSHNGYESNGWNYILDDDGHWCNPAFKMGATLNSGIKNDYGFVNVGCGKKVGGMMLYKA
jgi:hypothetical protein